MSVLASCPLWIGLMALLCDTFYLAVSLEDLMEEGQQHGIMKLRQELISLGKRSLTLSLPIRLPPK